MSWDRRERTRAPGDVPLLNREAAQDRGFSLRSIAIVQDVVRDVTPQLVAVIATGQRRRSHRRKTHRLGHRSVLHGVQEDEIRRVERINVDPHVPGRGALREEDDVRPAGPAQREWDPMEAPLPECLAETPIRCIPGARLQPTVETGAVGIEDRRQRERREVGRGRDSH